MLSNRKTLLTLAVMLTAAFWTAASGRMPDASLESAAVAWDRGDYVAALTTYLRLLDSPAAETALEPIALQTGELYRTTELTADGAAPRFSPDNRHLLYETGAGLARVTRVLASDNTTRLAAELPGFGAAFSPDGSKIAYFKIAADRELSDVQSALEHAPAIQRAERIVAVNQLALVSSGIVVHDLAGGPETVVDTGTLRKTALAYAAGAVLFSGAPAEGGPVQIYAVTASDPPRPLTTGPGDKLLLAVNASGTAALFTTRAAAGGQRGNGAVAAPAGFGMLSLPDGRTTMLPGTAPAFSGDGASFAYVTHDRDEGRVMAAPTSDPANGTIVRKGPERLDAPALSRDGSRVAYQVMSGDDWEIYAANRDGTNEVRVTREIQHDVLPVFLTPTRILAAIGEPRHRRSYLYDLPAMTRTRLFHNNTVRTIAPEYSWTSNADGTRLLISADRDGDTVSPERGIYLVDLSRRVSLAEVRARVQANLDAEQALRARARRMYAPIAAAVRQVVAGASVERIYGYEKALFDFDSKFVTQPGNARAAAFLHDTYRSFGYSPQYQTFEYRGRGLTQTGQTANVIATLEGTVNPELIYVVSSHYDSVAIGPGADDDSSGTAALLETARILSGHPQPATIVFASFTGEEAGLLGSREFVRRAVADKVRLAAALNNDMIGWANDERLDNTIRYSNAGIRDVQHAAAIQFSKLITYDAVYYKNTDAAAYYEAYGDIVGGIG
ncbi:MAG: M20/M25/M40 family metallo-hydrolase, partial [Acidobacteriota bacterium]